MSLFLRLKSTLSTVGDVKSAMLASGLINKGDKFTVVSNNNFSNFIQQIKFALKVIVAEPEVIFFSLLQIAVVILAYYAWVQIFSWISPDVWGNKQKIQDPILNLVFLGYSILCIVVASYPIGIFTGCVGTVCFLKTQNQTSTISKCLKIVLPRAFLLWLFTSIDSYITLDRILERLPKKRSANDEGYTGNSLAGEAAYYAWKVGSAGIVPAILAGHNLFSATKESLLLAFRNFKAVILLRGGYSLFCWIIGILSYISSILFFAAVGVNSSDTVFKVLLIAGVPIMITVTIIMLFLRPIYVLASCKLYAEHVSTNHIPVTPQPVGKSGLITFILFLLLTAALIIILLFHQQLGIDKLLSP